MTLRRKHVLDLDDFTADEIGAVLDTAEGMSDVLARPIKRVPALRGTTIVNCFYESSTRTRVSFELAAKNLSADVVNMTASGSSVDKGESLVDTSRTLQALGADMVVMRHRSSGAPYLVSQHIAARVINAGDGWHAHPTQALLDLFTVRRHLGDLAGLKLVIVGDIGELVDALLVERDPVRNTEFVADEPFQCLSADRFAHHITSLPVRRSFIDQAERDSRALCFAGGRGAIYRRLRTPA